MDAEQVAWSSPVGYIVGWLKIRSLISFPDHSVLNRSVLDASIPTKPSGSEYRQTVAPKVKQGGHKQKRSASDVENTKPQSASSIFTLNCNYKYFQLSCQIKYYGHLRWNAYQLAEKMVSQGDAIKSKCKKYLTSDTGNDILHM